jgi:hypothetical protein
MLFVPPEMVGTMVLLLGLADKVKAGFWLV